MDKATKVAVEKYPHGTFDGELGDSLRAACAVGYMQAEKDITDRAMFSSGTDGFFYGRGYKQAEKDLALTWEDIRSIIELYERRKAEDAAFDTCDYEALLYEFSEKREK